MPIFISRVLARIGFLHSWATPVVVSVFVFVTAWPLMVLTEGQDNPLVDPANYWWWFVVTAATVGYGDLYPETAGGHVVGTYVIVGGIATLTTIFTKLATILETARGRHMQGAITISATGHVVLLGYTPGRTERIADEVRADRGEELVLCAWSDTTSHPMPDRDVAFVRGDLTDADVLRRAGTHRASAVLVDVRDDNEALAVTLTVRRVQPDAPVVVALRDMARAEQIGYIDERISCVQWHTPRMVTEELESPGITEVYAELLTHGGTNTYSVTLPESAGAMRVGDCQRIIGEQYGATVLAARSDGELLVNPGWDDELAPGATLYYMAAQRIEADRFAASVRTGA
ncbi:MAG: ion transporter [Actinophytocola sp.]|nr:ion transporter [Actinophytocola sp.]